MRNRVLIQLSILSILCLSTALTVGIPDLAAQEEVVQEELVPLDLDDTEWDVTMVYVSEKGKKESTEDKLLFSEKKFTSKNYKDKGYSATNYSATAQPDGTTRFGTMQVKGKETSFWKGTVRNDTIDGSVHVQFAKGQTKTTYFNGKLVKGVLVPLGQKKPEPTPPPAPEPAVESQATDTPSEAAVPAVAPTPAADTSVGVEKQ